MLKHVPAAIFFLCLFGILVNYSILQDRIDLYIAAVVVGTLAMVAQHFMEQKEKKAKAPSAEEELSTWLTQKKHVEANLEKARRTGDDRIPFLESQLAEAEKQIKKLAR